MKKFVNIVLGVAAAMGLSSCEDFLTREPINKFSAETYFSSEAELKMYADGFINSWLPDYSEPAGGDMYNDIIASKGSTNFFIDGYNWTSATQGEWSWSWLRRINFMIEGMEKNALGKVSEDVYNHYMGVARFWRAYYTFDRMKTYGNIPWTPKYLQPDDTETLYADRLDRELVFNEIVNDLEYAIADAAVAAVAEMLGKDEDYDCFSERGGWWKHHYDPVTGFARGKDSNGNWREPFNPYQITHDQKIIFPVSLKAGENISSEPHVLSWQRKDHHTSYDRRTRGDL